MARPTASAARRQISVQELIQRVRAESSPPPAADRVERRVRAAVALEKQARSGPDHLTRWLVAGAAVVTALSAFALISFVAQEDPAVPPPIPAPSAPMWPSVR
ncbi:hypothetical protein [Amycolatopsis sp. lyj-346]|uniref:hypothetical protein n=1 Tax=Amycolatopsis sp. lyj-346 TaxID=2789289 RepID=UPI003979AD0E